MTDSPLPSFDTAQADLAAAQADSAAAQVDLTTAACSPAVRVAGTRVTIAHLEFDDPLVAGHLAALAEADREAEIVTALSVGVRGLGAMGSGATAHRVGDVVDQVVSEALTRTERQITELLRAGRDELGNRLDPDIRSSLTARTMDQFSSLHRELLDGIDPDRRDSRTARFVAELDKLLGPSGHLEQRLAEVFDPSADNSALASVVDGFERRFQELRDLIVGTAAAHTEAARGTAKGFGFEDVVEARLRTEARRIGGAVVERTSMEPGSSGPSAIVGDAVVTLPDGTRIVVEAKHTSRITLAGKGGILDELDRAMANRNAQWALCVSHGDAYPDEVGVFGIYGNRVLVVDDGSGELLGVALRWVSASTRFGSAAPGQIDAAQVAARLDRLRGLATRFSRAKRGLSTVQSGVDAVRCELDELRRELLDSVEELADGLDREARPAPPRVA